MGKNVLKVVSCVPMVTSVFMTTVYMCTWQLICYGFNEKECPLQKLQQKKGGYFWDDNSFG